MTSITNLWGTFGIAVLLGSLCGVWQTKRKTRFIVFTIVTLLAYLPVFFNTISVVNYLYAFYDVPAVSTICLVPCYWIWTRRPREFLRTEEIKHCSGTNRITLTFKIVLILSGALLYASEFNLFTFDVYSSGYSSNLALIVTCAILIFADKKISTIAVLSYFTYKTGLYTNYYDSILDLGLWLYLTITSGFQLVVLLVKRRRSNKKVAQSVSTETESGVSSTRKKLTLRR